MREVPASWQQTERLLWEGTEGTNEAQILEFLVRLGSSFTVGDVKRGIKEAMARHDVLRSSVRQLSGGDAIFVVHDDVPLPFTYIGHHRSIEDLTAGAARQIGRADPPLFQVYVGTIGGELVALWLVDHLIFDGYSLQSFLRSFVAGLTGASASPSQGLPRRQYADYCEWQQRRRNSCDWNLDRAFWENHACASSAMLITRRNVKTDTAATSKLNRLVSHTFSTAPSSQLMQLTGRSNTTIFKAILTALTIAYVRISGKSDVVFMLARSGRPREFRRTVGWFANVLPLCISWPNAESERDLLMRVKRTDATIEQHQHVPTSLATHSTKVLDPGTTPYIVALPPGPVRLPSIDGRVELVNVGNAGAHLDYKLVTGSMYARLECRFNDNIHDAEIVRRILVETGSTVEEISAKV